MGVGSQTFSIVEQLCKANYLKLPCKVMEIGAQHLNMEFLDNQALQEALFSTCNIDLKPLNLHSLLDLDKLKEFQENSGSRLSNLYTKSFWEYIACPYKAIDVDNSPHAIPLDLNYDKVPRKWRNYFDLVINAGTTEHLANQINAFEIMHNLTSVGGIQIHELPAGGYTDHGLINYNPKFFQTLCRPNKYNMVYIGYSRGFTKRKMCDEHINPTQKMCRMPNLVQRPNDFWDDYSFEDLGLIVVLQKLHDTPFVPPFEAWPEANQIRSIRKRYKLKT